MEQGAAPHRRIGVILVERGLIDEAQLEVALAEQDACGRPLGEICVERFGLDRLHLADALARQWEEIRSTPNPRPNAVPVVGVRRMAVTSPAGESELRVLLGEAQAARAELEQKTDELSKRLAALEELVADVSVALAEIRPAEAPKPPARATRKPANRRSRAATA